MLRPALIAAILVVMCGCKDDEPDDMSGSGAGGAAGSTGGSSGSGGTTGGSGGASGATGGSGGMTGGSGGASGATGGSGGMTGGSGGMTGGSGGMTGGSGGMGGGPSDPCLRAVTTAGKCAVCEEDDTCDAPTYTPNGNGTVTSSCCGLEWQQVVDAEKHSWVDATTYCTGLALDGGGFRVPTKDELLSLVVEGNDPPIDMTAFPDTPSGLYWSATPDPDNAEERAWEVSFNAGGNGVASTGVQTLMSNVRCVR
jgi:hypothetical protein